MTIDELLTMKIFILEDDEIRIQQFIQAGVGHELTIARDIESAKRKYAPPYDLMLLDHDLGGGQFVDCKEDNTGSGFCRWAKFPAGQKVIIHSYNPTGAQNMRRLIDDKHADVWCYYLPFGPALLNMLKKN